MPDGQLVKAVVHNLDTNDSVECMFNPKEYTFTKQNNWKFTDQKGKNLPEPEFQSGQPTNLKMQLFFDTFETSKDVRKEYTSKIWDLTRVNEDTKNRKTKKGRPPLCQFQWGQNWAFKAVVTNISQRFTLFLADGTPVRATLDVTFQQIEDEGLYPRQNPTSGGGEGRRVHIVREGERIDWIATTEYGDPSLWRLIAKQNALDDPLMLEPGQKLAIPPLP
ncbi:MAG: peptidoglycan-binding protein [Anaerolineae bacterium]|jgi:hypothetical protein